MDTQRERRRLAELQDDIDRQRRRLEEEVGPEAHDRDEPRFKQKGEAGGPVDDTIVPFG